LDLRAEFLEDAARFGRDITQFSWAEFSRVRDGSFDNILRHNVLIFLSLIVHCCLLPCRHHHLIGDPRQLRQLQWACHRKGEERHGCNGRHLRWERPENADAKNREERSLASADRENSRAGGDTNFTNEHEFLTARLNSWEFVKF